MSIHSLIEHPKTFLKDNAVWVGTDLAWTANGTPDTKLWPVTMRTTQKMVCKQSDGTLMPCWEIVKSTSLDCVLAYYLPYVPNATKEMTIGTKAKLFLTDALDGCTFAHNGGGSAKVAHINYTHGQISGNPIDQPAIDAEVNRLFPGGNVATLKKADYQTATMSNVTVVGVLRHGGTWEFVAQKRDYVGSTQLGREFRFISVHRVR